ncbi:MAG TPA: sialidase family protein [Pedobacter sp.]|jgi:predicted neuraminidase
MKSLIRLILYAAVIWSISCRQPSPSIPPIVEEIPPADTSLPKSRIIWHPTSKRVSHDVYFAEYGRVRRLAGDTLLLVYHCGTKKNEWDNIALRKSVDNGTTWNPAEIIVPDNSPNYAGFSTPDLLLLKNGWLLLSYTGKGIPDDSTHNNLQIRISKNGGENWGEPRIVALGRSWEPGMLQMPDGEIQLFFSSEILSTKRSKTRHEQQILLIKSKDNGTTWSVPQQVAFTPGRRDGMPVPVLLKDNKGIIFPVEAVNNETSPEIIWSSVKSRWNYKQPGTKENKRRWYAGVNPIWGGAPCVLQLPSGETVISMQTEGGRKIDRYKDWKKNTMLVMMGNSMARNFRNISRPYPDLPVDQGAYFSSLFLKNDSTIVLLSTRTFPDKNSGVFWKEGHVVRD